MKSSTVSVRLTGSAARWGHAGRSQTRPDLGDQRIGQVQAARIDQARGVLQFAPESFAANLPRAALSIKSDRLLDPERSRRHMAW